MKVSILTLGCKVNQSESALIEGNLRNHGFCLVGLAENPDYCIINTCTVTAKSDYQSRQLIRRAVRSGAKVFVTGCYSQLRPDEVKKIDDRVDIIQNNNKYLIIDKLLDNRSSTLLSYSSRSRPYVKVQDGCNYSCSYCIVPLARGRSQSIEVPEVVRQVISFEESGYHEIVLTGIHLGLYGYDLNPKTKLSSLIKTLLKKTKIWRIRLSSLEINEVNDELIELLQEKRICDHIHFPLQSGDNSILKKMNRPYTTGDYISVINKIINKVHNLSIGTDVIVGFPGEGEREFANTKDLVETVPFSYMHIFPFSMRPNTQASKIGDNVPFQEKKKRFNELNDLIKRKREGYLSSQTGRILDMIVEEMNDDETCFGTTSNYVKVRAAIKSCSKKSCIPVRITGREENILRGIPIKNS